MEFYLFDKRASIKNVIEDSLVVPHVITDGCGDKGAMCVVVDGFGGGYIWRSGGACVIGGGKKSGFVGSFVVGDLWRGM